MAVLVVLAAVIMLAGSPASRAGDVPHPAVPADPIATIVEAAKSRPIVALGEGQHWNEQGHRFRLTLIRDPRFVKSFTDIVVEFGNSRYQSVMDQFIAGDAVPDDTIRQAWENTTQPNEVWDIPIYEEFFRAVRALNVTLPQNRRLRVVLADPPIDWNMVKGRDDILRWMEKRDSFAAGLIRAKVLDKNRRALLIFGDGHLWRKSDQPTVVSLLTEDAPSLVFSIGTPTTANLPAMQSDTATWSVPSIALLKGTVLGAAPFAPFYETPFDKISGEPWDHLHMEDEFDALLYLGPPDSITLAPVSPALCADSRYMSMRLSRLALVPWGQSQIDRLKGACEAAGK